MDSLRKSYEAVQRTIENVSAEQKAVWLEQFGALTLQEIMKMGVEAEAFKHSLYVEEIKDATSVDEIKVIMKKYGVK